MQRSCLMLVVAGLAWNAGWLRAQSAPLARQQIEAVMADMGRAAGAHDARSFMTGYRHGPALVFVINGVVIHGWDALYKQQVKWWHNGMSDVTYQPTAPTQSRHSAPKPTSCRSCACASPISKRDSWT